MADALQSEKGKEMITVGGQIYNFHRYVLPMSKGVPVAYFFFVCQNLQTRNTRRKGHTGQLR